MLGETNPADSLPGTIRGDFAVQVIFLDNECQIFFTHHSIKVGRNICHGSDAVESANNEIALWFKPEELVSWEPELKDWIYE